AAAHGALRSRDAPPDDGARRLRGRRLPAVRRVPPVLLSFLRHGLSPAEGTRVEHAQSHLSVLCRAAAAVAGVAVCQTAEPRHADRRLLEASLMSHHFMSLYNRTLIQ